MLALPRILARCEPTTEGCLLWTGATDTQGGGRVRIAGRLWSVHRVVYEVLSGPIPDGFDLAVTCEHYACVEPTHRAVKSRSECCSAAYLERQGGAYCRRGHPRSLYGRRCGENRWDCRACQRLRRAVRARRKR